MILTHQKTSFREKYADVYIKEFEEIYYDEFVKVEIFYNETFHLNEFHYYRQKAKRKNIIS